jgi:tellurite resistance protein TerC
VEVTATAWVATIAVIIVLLGVDLAVGALRPHAVGFAEATA